MTIRPLWQNEQLLCSWEGGRIRTPGHMYRHVGVSWIQWACHASWCYPPLFTPWWSLPKTAFHALTPDLDSNHRFTPQPNAYIAPVNQNPRDHAGFIRDTETDWPEKVSLCWSYRLSLLNRLMFFMRFIPRNWNGHQRLSHSLITKCNAKVILECQGLPD